MGPKTVPCGTPEMTLVTLELTPLTTTCCFLFDRKLNSHLPSLPLIIKAFSLQYHIGQMPLQSKVNAYNILTIF